jgi:hypothetical protein
MAGTPEGGQKVRDRLRAEMGEEAYRKHVVERGRKGGLSPKTKPGGFAVMDREKHLELSRKGGEARRGIGHV